MHKLVLVVVATFLFALTAIGQTDDEYRKLCRWLDVSLTTKILPSSDTKLTANALIKIHVATGTDERARAYYAKWVADWNRGTGQKVGQLAVVQDLMDADLIIVNLKGDKKVEQRGSIGSVPGDGPRTTQEATKSTLSVGTHTQIYHPLYAYLLLRTPAALELVYRHVDHSIDGSDPDGKLVNELKKKIKQR
jgi:RNA-binding protein YhbY